MDFESDLPKESHMPLSNLIAAAGAGAVASGLVATLAGYLIKHAFEKTLDLRFEKFKEQNRQEINEEFRRGAYLYDTQAAVYKQLVATIYRLRNIYREVRELSSFNRKYRELTIEYSRYARELEKTMFEHRAILPPEVFSDVHRAKRYASDLAELLAPPRTRKQPKRKPNLKETLGTVEEKYAELNDIYESLLERVQKDLGVSLDGSDRAERRIGGRGNA
jgi:hypothetical protein